MRPRVWCVLCCAAAALLLSGCRVERRAGPESVEALRVDRVFRLSERVALSAAAWSPDSLRLSFGTQGGVWTVGVADRAEQFVAAAGTVTSVSWSRALDLLAYVDRGRLFTVKPDGSALRAVPLPGLATGVAWAPGSDRMAVSVLPDAPAESRAQVWLASRDGGYRKLVVESGAGAAVRTLQWFPDNLYLFYTTAAAGSPGVGEAWRVRIAYPDRVRLPLIPDSAAMVSLAPNGRDMAFVATAGDEVRGDIRGMRTDGSVARIMVPAAGRVAALTWAPQADKIAYAVVRDEANAEIWMADASGRARARIAHYRMEFPDPHIALSLVWAPDGRQIAFGTNTGSFTGPVWVARLERR
ncbi:MAG: hypothetical protein HY660_14285 [Armatimonadetes bacterium]|nr:hypothetical protein [Armatimonadota bacterium]